MLTYSPKNATKKPQQFSFVEESDATAVQMLSHYAGAKDTIFHTELEHRGAQKEPRLLDPELADDAISMSSSSSSSEEAQSKNEEFRLSNAEKEQLAEQTIKLRLLEKELEKLKDSIALECSKTEYTEEFVMLHSFKFGDQDDSFKTDELRIRQYLNYYAKYTSLFDVNALQYLESCRYSRMHFMEDVQRAALATGQKWFTQLEVFRFEKMDYILEMKTIEVSLKVIREEITRVVDLL